MDHEETLEIGYIARAHGVRGELRAHLHSPSSTTLLEVAEVFVGGTARRIVSARPTTGGVLLRLENVDGRDAAEALRGQTLAVRRADVRLAEGEYLLADLVGCEVLDEAERPVGRITAIMLGAQDLLVIQDDSLERLLPVVPEFLRKVDVAARRVTVFLPEGLPAEPIDAVRVARGRGPAQPASGGGRSPHLSTRRR